MTSPSPNCDADPLQAIAAAKAAPTFNPKLIPLPCGSSSGNPMGAAHADSTKFQAGGKIVPAEQIRIPVHAAQRRSGAALPAWRREGGGKLPVERAIRVANLKPSLICLML